MGILKIIFHWWQCFTFICACLEKINKMVLISPCISFYIYVFKSILLFNHSSYNFTINRICKLSRHMPDMRWRVLIYYNDLPFPHRKTNIGWMSGQHWPRRLHLMEVTSSIVLARHVSSIRLCYTDLTYIRLHNITEVVDRLQKSPFPANTRHWTNVVLMLGRRRRRRANIITALGQCHVFAGWHSDISIL